MTRRKAEEIGGKLSWPSKMDCPAHGFSAKYRITGAKLAEISVTTCEGYYALKGSFTFSNVVKVMEDNYHKLQNVLWVPAMVAQIRWEAEDRMRWLLSGDLQSNEHFRNILRACRATRDKLHWIPTREGATVRACAADIPDNAMARVSGEQGEQAAAVLVAVHVNGRHRGHGRHVPHVDKGR